MGLNSNDLNSKPGVMLMLANEGFPGPPTPMRSCDKLLIHVQDAKAGVDHLQIATMNRQEPPSVLQTPGFAHYNLAWSPFHTSRLAVASSANYGLVGNGRLHLTSVGAGPGIPGGQPALNLEKQCVLCC
jgi:hypothetical protein